MIAFACILMLAASTRVDLVDEVYRIPANEWRYVEVDLKQRPALVAARYEVESANGDVRVALLRREDMERLREGLPHGVIDETVPGRAGALMPVVRGPGAFALVVDNRAQTAAKVHLRVWLDFNAPREPGVTKLSPRRQLTVILVSFAVFFGIVTWSARRLLRGIRH